MLNGKKEKGEERVNESDILCAGRDPILNPILNCEGVLFAGSHLALFVTSDNNSSS
jgi:hypothetical protein